MHFPHTFNCREHDAVDDSPSGLKNADNGVREIGVTAAAFGQTVRPCKNIARHEASYTRDLSADHDFLRHAPHPTRLQRGAIKLHIRWTGTDDAKGLVAIAQRQRNCLLDHRRRNHRCGITHQYVASWDIDLEHRRQNELQRATFGTDDEIDASRIAVHALL